MDQRRINQFRSRRGDFQPHRWRGGNSNQYFQNQPGRKFNRWNDYNNDRQYGEFSNNQFQSNQWNHQPNGSLADFLLGESKLKKGGQMKSLTEFQWSDEAQEQATKIKLSDVASKIKNKIKSCSEAGDADDKSIKSESENSDFPSEEPSNMDEPRKRTAHVRKPFPPTPPVQSEVRRKSNEQKEKPPEDSSNEIKTIQRNIPRRVIMELLAMPKANLKEFLSDPKMNPKIEMGVNNLVRESKLLLAQNCRNVAEAKMTHNEFQDSQSVRDLENMMGVDLAKEMYELPAELLNTIGKMFELSSDTSCHEEMSNNPFSAVDFSNTTDNRFNNSFMQDSSNMVNDSEVAGASSNNVVNNLPDFLNPSFSSHPPEIKPNDNQPKYAKYLKKKSEEIKVESIPLPESDGMENFSIPLLSDFPEEKITPSPVKSLTPSSNIMSPSPQKPISNVDEFDINPWKDRNVNPMVSPSPSIKKETPCSPVSKASSKPIASPDISSNYEWSSEEDFVLEKDKDKNQNIKNKPLPLLERLKNMQEVQAERVKSMSEVHHSKSNAKKERNIKCKNFIEKLEIKKLDLVDKKSGEDTPIPPRAEKSNQSVQVDIKKIEPVTLKSFENNLKDFLRSNQDTEALKRILNFHVINLHGECKKPPITDVRYTQTETKEFDSNFTQTDKSPEKIYRRTSVQTDAPVKTVKKPAGTQTIIKSSEVSNVYGVPIPTLSTEDSNENLLNEVKMIDRVLHKLNERKFNIFLKLSHCNLLNDSEVSNSFLHTITNGDTNVWKHIFTKDSSTERKSSSYSHKKPSRDRSHSDNRHKEKSSSHTKHEKKKEEKPQRQPRSSTPQQQHHHRPSTPQQHRPSTPQQHRPPTPKKHPSPKPYKTKAELKSVTSLSQLKTPLEEAVTKDESFVKKWVESQDPTKYEEKTESDTESRSRKDSKPRSERDKRSEKSDRKSDKKEKISPKKFSNKKTEKKEVVTERPVIQELVQNAIDALEIDLMKQPEPQPEVAPPVEVKVEIPEEKPPQPKKKSSMKKEADAKPEAEKVTPETPSEKKQPIKKKRQGKKFKSQQTTDEAKPEETPSVPGPAKKRKRKNPPEGGESSQPVKNVRKKKKAAAAAAAAAAPPPVEKVETPDQLEAHEKPAKKRFKRLLTASSTDTDGPQKPKARRKTKSTEDPVISDASDLSLTNRMKMCSVLIERLNLPVKNDEDDDDNNENIPSENNDESALIETKAEGDCDNINKNFDEDLPPDSESQPHADEERREEPENQIMLVEERPEEPGSQPPPHEEHQEEPGSHSPPHEEHQEEPEIMEVKEETLEMNQSDVNNSMPFSTATETSDDDQDTVMDLDNNTVSGDTELPTGNDLERRKETIFDSSVSDHSQQFLAVQNGDALSRNSESVQGCGSKKRKISPISFSCHKGVILEVKVIGKHIFAACEDKLVYCYSIKSGKRKKEYSGHNDAVTSIAFLTGKKDYTEGLLFTGSLDSHVRSFVIKTSALSKQSPALPSQVQCLEENWGVVYAGLKNGLIMKFHAKTLKVINPPLEVSQQSVMALKTLMEGPRKIIIVATRSNSITIRDGTTGLLLRSIDLNFRGTVYSLTYDSNQIYCGTSEAKLFSFDFTDGSTTGEYDCGPGVLSIKIVQNLIFASSYDGKIYVIDSKTKERVGVIQGPGKMLMAMDIYKNRQIVASSNDKKLETWAIPAYIRNLLKRAPNAV